VTLDGNVDRNLEEALAAFAARDRVLVALDFDGVCAPIVEVPSAARALPATSAAVAALAAADGVEVAFVSGRQLADLRAVAAPPDGALLVGSHGAETSFDGGGLLSPEQADLLARADAALVAITGRHPGTRLERKPTGVVLHTRVAARDVAAAATAEALAGPATWPGVHVTHGKEVVELAVTGATKGSILAALRQRLGLATGGVLYAGDDVTDERAFAVLDDDAGDVTVKVGPGDTAARHRVAGPPEVATFLARLVELRG
jgi:trehalose-phosphatase